MMKVMKLKESAIFVLAVPVLLAQSSPAPVWKEFSIGPATRNQSGFSREGIRAEGIPLKRALARAWGLPELGILGPQWIDDQRYAMTALVNDPRDFQPLMQEEMTRRFKMLAHRETREMPVYLLRSLDGQPPPQAPRTDGTRAPSMGIKAGPMTVSAFADALADAIQRPVVDETHLPGTFRFELSWKSTDFESMRKAVNEQLGFQLAEEKRNIEVLVIEHIEPL
jgi:uncharacterized protein (TIGR03435 family)